MHVPYVQWQTFVEAKLGHGPHNIGAMFLVSSVVKTKLMRIRKIIAIKWFSSKVHHCLIFLQGSPLLMLMKVGRGYCQDNHIFACHKKQKEN
jgi:hypothetical protein